MFMDGKFIYTEEDRKEAEPIAARIKESDCWLFDLGPEDSPEYQLCRLCGLEDELDAAGEYFEPVVYKAAELLHVDIEHEFPEHEEC